MNGPDPNDVWLEVIGWLRVAERDQRAATICLRSDPPLPDVVAFHCQQAAEKLPKGFLVHACIDFGKTHDLEELGSIVVSRYPSVERLMVAMGDWTNWNVAYRYPDIMPPVPEPSAEELTRALDLISQLADTLRSLGPPAEQDETTQGA